MTKKVNETDVLDAETLAFLAEFDREMADTEAGRESLKRRKDHERMLAYKEQKRRENLPDTELASDDFIIREMIRANTDGLRDKGKRFEMLNREMLNKTMVSSFAKTEMVSRGYMHGLVTVAENTICVVDPGYVKKDDMMGVVDNVRNGRYVARSLYEEYADNMTGWIVRGVELVHVEFDGADLDYEVSEISVGVDSGMVGLFTKSAIESARVYDAFYNDCCNSCHQPVDAMKYEDGVVSSTMGDGTFSVRVLMDNDETVAVRVLFSDYVDEFE